MKILLNMNMGWSTTGMTVTEGNRNTVELHLSWLIGTASYPYM